MASRDKKPAKPSSSRAGGIRTLSDLNRPSGPDSDSDSDDPQEYYTGGEKRVGTCKEPEKKRQVAFQGVGRTLGSSSTSAAPEPTTGSSPLNTAPNPSPGLVVDESLPSTSIQLRLADGTRMITRFNLHHTVDDIRSFINAYRPGGATNYQLQIMGFPPKLLTDPTQTIEQAGLANSVVIQKF
ncbi:plant UBX domain-containing protein 4-like [Gossypium australe]|uniref:Plant UBX domain-containing protein 4-like n=1 Tax=Gossypium australe TaxID=47621 RepID=A0A5B6X468_9ROSI|nr:plant UBX domain-containing protein 4-like [Gossypium australe]